MTINIFGRLGWNFRTRKDWGIALTVFTPIALVLGRSVADGAVSIVAILFLFDSFTRRQWNWMHKAWISATLLLWIYSVLRASFVPDGGASWFAALVWLRYIVFAASLSEWALSEEKGRVLLLHACIAAVLFLSLDGLMQYVFGHDILGNELRGDRLTGVYNRPILGMTIANLFAPAIFWLLERKHIYKAVFLSSTCLAAVFLSGDRMGLIFAATIMVAWTFFLMRAGINRWKYLAATVCFFSTLVLVAPHLKTREAPSPVERQIYATTATIKKFGSSPYGLVWKSALHIGEDSPFFGVGTRQFRVVCPEERFGPVKDPENGNPRCFTHPHNAYLEWFSEEGTLGLLGFIAFVAIVADGIRRRLTFQDSDLLLWGLAVMLAVRLMPFFISTSFFNNWSAIPFWLALGWAMSYKPVSPERKPTA